MTPKKNYLDLPDKVLLATIVERLDNLIDLDLPKRVNRLENYKSMIWGICIGAGSCGGLVGFIISNAAKVWAK